MFPPRVQRGIELGVEAHRKGYLDPTRLQAVLTFYDREGALEPPEPEVVLQRIGGLTTGQLTELLGVAAEPVEGTPFTDRLSLLEPLGEGAMGAVYRAWDRVLKRTVAVKVIKPDRLDAANAGRLLARFEREAEAMARVRHPACVPIFDAGVEKESGRPYIVMGLVAGKSLRQLIAEKEGPLDWRRVAAWGRDLALALQACHDVGVVHRDVKPANVLVDAQDRPFLTDFGVALDDQARTKLTAEQAAVGTLAYMAPEQATGHPVDARVDVYALGATLYEAATGRAPFEATHALLLIRQIVEADPEPVRKLAQQAPADLEAVLQQALAKSREERYATAQALALDLGRLLAGEPVLARHSEADLLGRWVRRHRRPLILAAAVFMGLPAALLLTRNIQIRRLRAEVLATIEAAAVASDLTVAGRDLARHELVEDIELSRAVRAAQEDLQTRQHLTEGREALRSAHVARSRVVEIDAERARLERALLFDPALASEDSLRRSRRANQALREAERALAFHLDTATRAATSGSEVRRATERRQLLADALALRVELEVDIGERQRLLADLQRLDPTHVLTRPVPVQILGPTGGSAVVSRFMYEPDSGRLQEQPVASGSTPLGTTLPPGDYVAGWECRGSLPTRRCVRVQPGAPREVTVSPIPLTSLGALALLDVVHVPGGVSRSGERMAPGELIGDLLAQRFETPLEVWRSFEANADFTTRTGTRPGGRSPARFVTFQHARRFAEWLTAELLQARAPWRARLPTRSEMHWFVRGEFDWIFPWGPTPEPTFFANALSDRLRTASLDQFPEDRAWCGLRGLAGSCSEWVQPGPTPGEAFQVFGSSILETPTQAARTLLGSGFYPEDLSYDANTVRLVFEPCPLPDVVTDRAAAERHAEAAMRLEVSKELFEAQNAWTQAIEASPLDPTLWQRRGACRLNRGDLWGAHWDFSRALAIGSEHDDVNLYNRAYVQLERGLLAEAAADASTALQKRPDWVEALILLGRIQTAQADYVAARVTLQRALRLATDAATTGRVQQRLAEVDEAERKQTR